MTRPSSSSSRSRWSAGPLVFAALTAACVWAVAASAPATTGQSAASAPSPQDYESADTRALVRLVTDASALVAAKGEGAFAELRVPNSRWRQGEAYVFVLDPGGLMLVHPDPALEGKNEIDLKDVNGRPIIAGLLHAAMALPGKTDGWYHYQWPVPGGLLPRWKSTYVRAVTSAKGERFVVGSGIYNDRMERAFVVDMVNDAAGQIETRGPDAFALFRDRTGVFLAKDAYVFVIDPDGTDLVNPAFPNLQGRNLMDVKDTQGKALIREMFQVVGAQGAGWVDYMWPKPGESVSTVKSTYVRRAVSGGKWYLVGCGVYLADAPKAAPAAGRMTAPELASLVRDGAALFAAQGEHAFPTLRTKGSRWFHDDTYFIVMTLSGTRVFHAADPTLEGKDVTVAADVLGRRYGRMFVEAANNPSGEGWVHYMYPEPGSLFPAWKSTFITRVTSPSGQPYFIGAGVYAMQMDTTLIEDVVTRASALVAARGPEAFAEIRDKTGPFVFMDTYVFVDSTDGVELVNPAQPSIEGTNISDLRDAKGKALAREYIAAALKDGAAWVDYDWYKPGGNTPTHKRAYVRAVRFGTTTYIVGSGLYVDE